MFNTTKRSFVNYNYTLFFTMVFLCITGIMCIYSATITPTITYSIFFKKQIIGLISGIIIYFLCLCTDHRSILRWGFLGYFCVIGLLLFTLLKGHIGMGAQRWINFGLFKIQPSELVKLFFPLCATFYFQQYINGNNKRFLFWIPLIILLIISCILILKQPDLGTALIIFASGLVMFWLTGMTTRIFTFGLIFIAFTSPIIWHNILKNYQKKRIIVFFGGGSHNNERYQIEQAKIAIGSGGILGKGFCKGTQNKLRFLPEGRTDFIFAVLAEECGFFGTLLILLLYCLFFFKHITIAKNITSIHMRMCVIGLIMPIMLATITNIGMVLGLLPVVGMPLPFMSYGVSNLWITYASLGVIQNITMHYKNTVSHI